MDHLVQIHPLELPHPLFISSKVSKHLIEIMISLVIFKSILC